MANSLLSSHRPDRPAAASSEDAWQAVLAASIRSPAELCRLLSLPPRMAKDAGAAARQFPMLVPRTYLARIRPGQPHDPLLAQVLPQGEEQAAVTDFVADPLGEAAAACGRRWLRKYQGRLLILASRACGVHCRFCFRRHFPAPDGAGDDLRQAVGRVAAEPSIEEVVLSGGDPLVVSDAELAPLAAELAGIPHLRRIRIHTRMPIAIPQRVNDELLAWLCGTRLTPLVVVHVNHPAEIDAAVAAALARLVEAGVPVLSQTVLLRGVNDDVEVLAELFGRLVDLRVMPYYLHQLDRVAGAAHFEVAVDRGMTLVRELRTRLPGYAVPRYVRDTPGAANKEVLA
jgi:EF-P beta-lysylation protein EpmB